MITQTPSEDEQNIAFRRMKHFIHSELESTIFIDREDVDQCRRFVEAGLNITTLPGAPGDQLVGIMIFHKINAIMEGRIAVVEIEVRAEDGVIYLHSENETSVGYQQPDWWTTADLTHSDQLTVDENIVSLQSGATWRDYDLAWPESETPEESGNTIVFANFKSSDETK